MKKCLLVLLALVGFSARAQYPLEGIAEDFTATDINGNQHHLQEYLDQGKIVILDFFATWCPPCWEYHDSHFLANLYKTFGPEGSDEIVVLSIECDQDTNMDDLYGLTEMSQGNWIKDTPYPIIDNHILQYYYDVDGYPSYIMICPDGSQAYLQGPAGNPDIYGHYYSQLSYCEMAPLETVNNHAEIGDRTIRVCEDTGMSEVYFWVKNYGMNDIANFEVVLKKDGTPIHTQAFTQNFEKYKTKYFVLDEEIDFDSSHQYTLELTQINGAAPFTATLENKELEFSVANTVSNNLTVLVHTDRYPGEMTWEITDSNNNVVVSGGPYGTDEGLSVITYNVTIPEGVQDCFNVKMYDEYGDGWSTDHNWLGTITVEPGIEILSNGSQVLFIDGIHFGTAITENHAFKTNGSLSTPVAELSRFSIYPNPSSGVFNFRTDETVSVNVMDLTGKMVYSATAINDGESVDLSQLQKGVYLAKVQGATTATTQKLIIK